MQRGAPRVARERHRLSLSLSLVLREHMSQQIATIIIVPADFVPGSTHILLRMLNGDPVQIAVPPGLHPSDQFCVHLPTSLDLPSTPSHLVASSIASRIGTASHPIEQQLATVPLTSPRQSKQTKVIPPGWSQEAYSSGAGKRSRYRSPFHNRTAYSLTDAWRIHNGEAPLAHGRAVAARASQQTVGANLSPHHMPLRQQSGHQHMFSPPSTRNRGNAAQSNAPQRNGSGVPPTPPPTTRGTEQRAPNFDEDEEDEYRHEDEEDEYGHEGCDMSEEEDEDDFDDFNEEGTTSSSHPTRSPPECTTWTWTCTWEMDVYIPRSPCPHARNHSTSLCHTPISCSLNARHALHTYCHIHLSHRRR